MIPGIVFKIGLTMLYNTESKKEKKGVGITPRFLMSATGGRKMPSAEMGKLVVGVIFRGHIRS